MPLLAITDARVQTICGIIAALCAIIAIRKDIAAATGRAVSISQHPKAIAVKQTAFSVIFQFLLRRAILLPLMLVALCAGRVWSLTSSESPTRAFVIEVVVLGGVAFLSIGYIFFEFIFFWAFRSSNNESKTPSA